MLFIFSLRNLISCPCNHTDRQGWLNIFDLSRVDTFKELESYIFLFRAFDQRLCCAKGEREQQRRTGSNHDPCVCKKNKNKEMKKRTSTSCSSSSRSASSSSTKTGQHFHINRKCHPKKHCWSCFHFTTYF